MRAALLVLWSVMVLMATPLISAAQESGKTLRVGYVRSGSFANDPYREPFLRGMRERGWIAGRNIAFEFRYYGDDAKAIPPMMHDLLRLKIDVIAVGGAAATRAAQAATRSVPIVMVAGDPLAGGLITGLARPGGNTTGLSVVTSELTAKRLELIKELLPLATRIAILQNPDNPSNRSILKEVEPLAGSLGLSFRILAAHSVEDINHAFATIRAWPADAVIALDDSAFIANRRELATQAIRRRLPLVCGFPELAAAGCLVSYAVSIVDAWYRSAAYVDKILKGARPGDLPVEQASKFELLINLKTANALGLTIPPSLLQRADEVIE